METDGEIRSMSENEFFLDPSRCIGCQACVQACGECGTHRGVSMIHLEYVDRATSTQTGPVVCMHCENPTCAQVCPADAIKQTDDGVVQSSLKPRCIGCSNCVMACPFGVPRYKVEIDQMMKCDMCYDRTSIGKKPMCATVCPSGALYFGPREYIEKHRQEKPVNEFQFGRQLVRTKVNMMTSPQAGQIDIDVIAFMSQEESVSRPGAPDAADGAVWDDFLIPHTAEKQTDALAVGE
jgi:Fe-S-cluster-containing dehydrogenase component